MTTNGAIHFIITIGEQILKYKNDGIFVIITNLDGTGSYGWFDLLELIKRRFEETKKIALCSVSYFEDFIRKSNNPGETQLGFIHTIIRPDYYEDDGCVDEVLGANLEDLYSYYQYIYERPELSPKQAQKIKKNF